MASTYVGLFPLFEVTVNQFLSILPRDLGKLKYFLNV